MIRTRFVLAVLLTFSALSESFNVAPRHSQQRPQTALNLKVNQGSQLVAAFNAAYSVKEELAEDTMPAEGAVHTETAPKPSATAAARAFVSRVFSLPSSMIKRHPHPKIEGLPPMPRDRDLEADKDDVVLYPVVGFTYVKDKPDHSRVLPKVCSPSCRIPMREEPVYGWFTSACRLDVFSDEYCTEPECQGQD